MTSACVNVNVQTKINMNKKDLSLMTYWRSFWKDPEDSPKQPKHIYRISRTTKYSRESTRGIIPRRKYLCDIAA